MKFILVTMQVLILLIVLPVLARDVDVGLHKSSAQPTRASNSPKVWFRRIKQKACKCRLFV
jgi:hypothetical protein